MGHFEGRDDTQVYVGDDGKVYASDSEEVLLADSVDAFFGDNGKSPAKEQKTELVKKEKKPRKKETQPRKTRKDRFALVACPVCGKQVKKGAGLTSHIRIVHPPTTEAKEE